MIPLEGEILGVDEPVAEAQGDTVRKKFWTTFGKAARQLPFSEDLVAAYYCALDPRTPSRVRMILFGALAYFVMPADAIPDILAFVGFSDDVGVLTLALATVRGNITDAHRRAARKTLAEIGSTKPPPTHRRGG